MANNNNFEASKAVKAARADEQTLLELLEDAADISGEIEKLEAYLALDAKTPTINEYQIFETLYLKHKVENCLRMIDAMQGDSENETVNLLAQQNRMQFQGFKQVIDTLDTVNRARKISMAYTLEEAKFIKNWEDKKEEKHQLDPIKIRVTKPRVLKKSRLPKERLFEVKLLCGIWWGVLGPMCCLSLLSGEAESFIRMLLIAVVGNGLMLIVIAVIFAIHFRPKKERVSVYSRTLILDERSSHLSFWINDLWSASKELSDKIKYYNPYLGKELRQAFKECYKGTIRKFKEYDDYSTYVKLYIISEKANAKLVARGIIYKEEQEQKSLPSLSILPFGNKAAIQRKGAVQSSGIKSKEKQRKENKQRFLVNEEIRSYRHQTYSSTKKVNSNGRKGR